MIHYSVALFRVIIVFVFLFTCVSCNPYTSRRVPFGNSPYVSYKNCRKGNKQKAVQNKNDYIYDFVSEEEQNEIKPLPLPKRKTTVKRSKISKKKKRTSNKKTYIRPKKKPVSVHGEIKTQDLSKKTQKSDNKVTASSKTDTKTNTNTKNKTGYTPLSDSPKKEYSAIQQKKMLTKKTETIQKLSEKAKQVKNPNAQTKTLELEKAPAAPTQKGKEQLNKKLQELQNATQMQTSLKSQQQPSVQSANQEQQDAKQQQTLSQPQQDSVQSKQKDSSNQQQQQSSTQSKSESTDDSTYDIKNKPIPLQQ
ncbi:MAG: hypothetical protein HRU36_04525 [Rickettsiales bacterium]|nr:hypothetical protein [Rickettsiales bacterium]